MPDRLLTITRQQLAEFVKDQRALRAIEDALRMAVVTTPTNVATLFRQVQEVSLSADGAGASADSALSLLALIENSWRAAALRPASQDVQQDLLDAIALLPPPLPPESCVSLRKPAFYKALASSAGVVTVDCADTEELYLLTLTENVTSWAFLNLPPPGSFIEFYIQLTQNGSTAYTCVNPATAGYTAGGWTVSSVLGAIQELRLRVTDSGNITMVPSAVYA